MHLRQFLSWSRHGEVGAAVVKGTRLEVGGGEGSKGR